MKTFKGKVWEFFGVTALGGIFTVLLTWPLVTKLGSFYKDDGDFPLNGWILWYNQWAVKTGRIWSQSRYFDSTQIYPLPHTLAYSDHLFVPSLIFSPIFWLTHQLVFSVNAFALLTFILSFIAAYYVITALIENRLAAIVGALIYAFNPITFSSFPDHLQLMNKYFLPPLFLFAYRYFKKPTLKDAFLMFLFFTLNALSSIYFFVFTIIALPIFFLPFFIENLRKKQASYFASLVKYGLVFILFLPVLLHFNLPYLTFSKLEGAVRTPDLQRHFSARVIDWLAPDPGNLVYSKVTQIVHQLKTPTYFLPNQERALFMNILPTLLCLLGLTCLFRDRRALFWPFFAVLAGSFILIFGPYFLGWNSNYGNLRLPFYYLYELSPLLDGIRGPTRFQYLFYLPFSLFAGYGAIFIFHRYKKFSAALFVFFLAAILCENFTYKNYDEHSAMLSELTPAKKERLQFLYGKNTFHVPSYIPKIALNQFYREAAYLNWQTQTGETMLNGYSGYFPDDWVRVLQEIGDNVDENGIKKLKAIGVDFLIIHKNFFPKNMHFLADNLRFYEDDNELILSIKKDPGIIKPCSPASDIVKKDFKLYAIDGQPAFYQIALQNKADCYLASEGQARYVPLDIQIDSHRYHTYLKVPLLISPRQTVTAVGFIHTIKSDETVIPDAKPIH